MMKRLLPLLFVFCFTTPVFAMEDGETKSTEKMSSTVYAPDYCEFSATFPEQPYKTRRCEDKEGKEGCYDLISFTKVFDLSATVKIDIICNPSTPKMYEQLTLPAMETTVRAMTKGSVIEAFDVKSRQDSTYRQAGLLGKGKSGKYETIYIAQLWSGQKSMMSVEAQLIGDPMDAADEMFANILRSIGPIAEAKESEPVDQGKPEAKTTEPPPKVKVTVGKVRR